MKKIILPVLIGILAFVPAQVRACTIPVFRYALEKWDLTPYDILVFHRGPLPTDVQEMLKPWSDVPNKRANVEITVIDLDQKLDPVHRKLWERHARYEKTPWMLVRSQSPNSADAPAFNGPCTGANLASVLDSPMRQTILAHLTRGSSVVYLLLTSDDEKADRAAYDMTRSTLRMLEKKIKLPVQSETGPKIQLPLPLKVELPLLVLNRSDPREAAFVKLLLGTEDDLDAKQGPILFPIFGRGRALAALAEESLKTDKDLVFVTTYLCKECSCQVKDQNPGVDLLMLANWKEHFDVMFENKAPVPMPAVLPTSLPLREPISPKVEKAVEAAPKETPKFVDPPTPSSSRGPENDSGEIVVTPSPSMTAEPFCCPLTQTRTWLWIGTGVAGALVLASGAWLIVQLRK